MYGPFFATRTWSRNLICALKLDVFVGQHTKFICISRVGKKNVASLFGYFYQQKTILFSLESAYIS